MADDKVMTLRGVTEKAVAELRAPFPDDMVGHLPRGGTTLSYVGHAAVTDRLLSVDPFWTWEPVAFGDDGLPFVARDGKRSVLWIRLTVLGVTRLGVGIVTQAKDELEKELISDAIRNAAMRFGVALDLWSKTPLGLDGEHSGTVPYTDPTPLATKEQHDDLRARKGALTGEQFDAMEQWTKAQSFPWHPGYEVEHMQQMMRKLDEIEAAAGTPTTVGALVLTDKTDDDEEPF